MAPTRPAWVDAKLYPFKDHWLKVDGHTIHYLDEGPRDAPVLLFLHPGPSWSFMWRNHIKALGTKYRCLAPDFPGYGLSSAAPGYKFTLREQAAALEALVDHLNLRGITMWANDGGGATGMVVATRQPDRFQAFVVGGTFAWSFDAYPKVAQFLRFASGPVFKWVNRQTNLLARTQRSLGFGTRKLTKAEGDHYRKAFPKHARDRPLLMMRSFLDDAGLTRTMETNLDRVRDKPVLILFGEKDPMTKEGWADRWAKEFPNNQKHVLPKVMHFPFEDAPDQTLRLFQSWKDRPTPKPGSR